MTTSTEDPDDDKPERQTPFAEGQPPETKTPWEREESEEEEAAEPERETPW